MADLWNRWQSSSPTAEPHPWTADEAASAETQPCIGQPGTSIGKAGKEIAALPWNERLGVVDPRLVAGAVDDFGDRNERRDLGIEGDRA